MERGDLLEANGAIFTAQGKALNEVAADDVRIGVTGNPANTNALIAMTNAPDIPQERFSALTRLDHNRAISQLAAKTGAAVTDIKKMTIWGNHSATQYPDLFHAEVGGQQRRRGRRRPGLDRERLHPDRRQARRRDHRGPRLLLGRLGRVGHHRRRPRLAARLAPTDDWVSMAVVSDGSYGVPEGLISSFPVTTQDGDWEIVQGLEIDDFSRGPDRRLHRRAGRRARRRHGARPDLTARERTPSGTSESGAVHRRLDLAPIGVSRAGRGSSRRGRSARRRADEQGRVDEPCGVRRACRRRARGSTSRTTAAKSSAPPTSRMPGAPVAGGATSRAPTAADGEHDAGRTAPPMVDG